MNVNPEDGPTAVSTAVAEVGMNREQRRAADRAARDARRRAQAPSAMEQLAMAQLQTNRLLAGVVNLVETLVRLELGQTVDDIAYTQGLTFPVASEEERAAVDSAREERERLEKERQEDEAAELARRAAEDAAEEDV